MSATRPTKALLQGLEEMMRDETHRKVLRTLAQHKSMPFLELASVCDIDDPDLVDIVEGLEREGLVKVSDREDITEEIVTLKYKGLSLASAF